MWSVESYITNVIFYESSYPRKCLEPKKIEGEKFTLPCPRTDLTNDKMIQNKYLFLFLFLSGNNKYFQHAGSFTLVIVKILGY